MKYNNSSQSHSSRMLSLLSCIFSVISYGMVLCYLVLIPSLTYASGINDDLNNYFNDLGFSTSVTSPHAYNGQRAGYYSGGSLFMRSRVRQVQLVQVDLPSFHAGCSGIDLYAGGLSFVKADALVKAMKDVMNNAGSYAFSLALKTATPLLANVMETIHNKADEINRMNINSCETAEALVGGMWPRTAASQQQICRDLGSNGSGGLFSDWAQARQQCGTGGNFNSTMDKARLDPRYQNRVFDNGNVAWKAIKQNKLINGDNELAQFFMTLSGTVILSKEGSSESAPTKYTTLPSKMDNKNNNLIQALLKGGTAKIYKCDTTEADGCLHPTEVDVTITPDKSFGTRIRSLLDSIAKKIVEDTALSQEEIGLLQSTSLPIYKMLNVKVAFTKGNKFLDVTPYADAIANDILYQYLEESLSIVKHSLSILQIPDDIVATLKTPINQELEALRIEQKNAYTRLSSTLQIIQETQLIERMLAGELSTELANTLSWAKGLK